MNRWNLLGTAAAALVLSAVSAPGSDRAEGAPAAPATAAPRPVVAELFTSQGCSSCPPADRLLRALAERAPAGVQVIPLAFHVDYWDRLGWPDPFARPSWTARQRDYGVALGNGSRIYTPQLVLDGRGDCVGSDPDAVARELARAAERAPEVDLAATLLDRGDTLTVEVVATPRRALHGPLRLLAAVFDNGHVTAVGRGENARRSLHNDFVVRVLTPLAERRGTVRSPFRGRARIAIEPSWRRASLGVVVFVQQRDAGPILGAALAAPPT